MHYLLPFCGTLSALQAPSVACYAKHPLLLNHTFLRLHLLLCCIHFGRDSSRHFRYLARHLRLWKLRKILLILHTWNRKGICLLKSFLSCETESFCAEKSLIQRILDAIYRIPFYLNFINSLHLSGVAQELSSHDLGKMSVTVF